MVIRRDQRGSSSIEFAILAPLVFVMIFAIIMGGGWFHAGNVALHAAIAGARAEAAYQAAEGSGTVAANEIIAHAGGAAVLAGAEVTVTRTPDEVIATVTGTSLNLVPGLPITVSKTARAPIERITEVSAP